MFLKFLWFANNFKNIGPTPGGGPRVVVSTAAFHARVRGSVPGLGGFKATKMFLPHPRVKVSIVGSLRDREVACSASDRQGSNFESCVWRTVSSQSSHHPQEVLLAQLSLYVHKGGLKPDSFHLVLRLSKKQALYGVVLIERTQNTEAVITPYNCLKFTYYVNFPDFKLLFYTCNCNSLLYNIDTTCVTFVFHNAEALAKHVTVGWDKCKQHTTEAI